MSMTPERKNAELNVFMRMGLPPSSYMFQTYEGKPCLLMAARTNAHNVYTLHIELDQFPNSVPKVFVRKMLRTYYGDFMNDCSANMHTLTSEHGWTRICHYGYESWTPNVSLYKIYVKCRLWLEAYEAHLQTGKPLDTWLTHQA